MTVQITESIIVKGDASELFDLWENYEMFPAIMDDFKEVRRLDGDKSRWVVKGPLGKSYEWTAQITRHDEDRRIAWKTIEGDIKTSGQVTFKDLPHNETEITVMMQYVPPAGKLGDAISKMTTDPRGKVSDGLQSFKRYAENRTGKPNKDRSL